MREPKTAVGLASGTFNPLRSRTPNCHVGNAQLSLSFTPDMLRENLTTASPPDTGILSILPRSWVPYAELMRLDKPAGTYYLFLPCVFSTLLAAPLATPVAPISSVAGTAGLFAVGAFIMRGAGCTVNDLWDRNLDPHVTRTRLRPIARGAVSVKQAVPFLGGQLLAGLTLLLQLPWECFFYATPSLLFVATYPLAKRVTNYPQFVLGLTFSWGAIMGFPALGIDLLSNTPAMVSAACLYGSCVAWTMVYDMIYAYQDIRDDVKAGIKSIALAQEHNAKVFLTSVSALQVGLLAGAGAAIGAGPVFYAGVCGGAAGTLGYMIKTVNLQSVEDCWSTCIGMRTPRESARARDIERQIIRKFEVQRWDEGVAQDNVHVLSLPDSCERVVQHDTQLVYPHQRLPPKRGAAASISRKGRSRKFAHSTKRPRLSKGTRVMSRALKRLRRQSA
ncbi:4-hydroxybenzoate polyprenyl transferase [Hortaea werneckii]|nr:4-hydroxybenzoate polyprenyl transferase [Hortaea werneckii]